MESRKGGFHETPEVLTTFSVFRVNASCNAVPSMPGGVTVLGNGRIIIVLTVQK